jgi:hypothetical protein
MSSATCFSGESNNVSHYRQKQTVLKSGKGGSLFILVVTVINDVAAPCKKRRTWSGAALWGSSRVRQAR